jgi:hypothetical protein
MGEAYPYMDPNAKYETCLVLEISLFGSIVVKHRSNVFHIWHSDPYMDRLRPSRECSHSTYGSKLNFSFREYFNCLFAYLVITYYSLQFLSNGNPNWSTSGMRVTLSYLSIIHAVANDNKKRRLLFHSIANIVKNVCKSVYFWQCLFLQSNGDTK